ncbi:Lichenan permease IIC component [Lactococcus lactis]|nr:Lichenan permease IIC component [Lactococcus lactis]
MLKHFKRYTRVAPGLIVAIIIGFIVSLVYIQLSKRNLVIKLPAGVPPMVVDSLSPAIISMVIFCLMFGIRVGFSYTPFHDIFNFSTQLIQAPLTRCCGKSMGSYGHLYLW